VTIRVHGHRLTIEGGEGGHLGTCPCGWAEGGSTYAIVRDEYRHHLRAKRREQDTLIAKLCQS